MKRAPLTGGQSHPVEEAHGTPAIAGGEPIRTRDRRLIFGAPVIGEAEIASVTECLRSNWIGLGGRVERFEQEFARYKGAPYAAAVSSGTAAIHLALLALGIGAGDEVIAPAMTFCSTIHSIVHTGAKPVLVDCDRSTFNIDPAPNRGADHTRALRPYWSSTCAVAAVRWTPILDIAAVTVCVSSRTVRTPSRPPITGFQQA